MHRGLCTLAATNAELGIELVVAWQHAREHMRRLAAGLCGGAMRVLPAGQDGALLEALTQIKLLICQTSTWAVRTHVASNIAGDVKALARNERSDLRLQKLHDAMR